jgi:hypothetical protein
VFEDGPAPFFKRLQINSASIDFEKLNHLLSPEEEKEKKLIEVKRKQIKRIQNKSHFLKNQIKSNKDVVDYFNSNYLKQEEELRFKDLNEEMLKKEKELIKEINSHSII